ncbi:MAG: FkbM family methyltransferase [Gammaproteobacteria bacterium]|nr:FkbM family methyltransferase [Gammaproteobacteria bacterium]
MKIPVDTRSGGQCKASRGGGTLAERYLTYRRNPTTLTAIGLLKLYGVISRPFGYRWLAWVGVFAGKFLDRKEPCVAKLEPDADFKFFLADYYWNKLVCRGFRYEPEIETVLGAFGDIDYLFLDLGANYGYWSVLVSSRSFQGKQAIAVEPVRRNYRMLRENNRINRHRFTPVRAAVARQAGKTVRVHTHPGSLANEGATLLPQPPRPESESEPVPTISIDQLAGQYARAGQPIVVKLDVEGMEVEAVRGAVEVLKRDCLLIYEDHGSDAACRISRHLLGLGMSVAHLEFGDLHPVCSLEDVRDIKTRANKGYNLFAYREGSVFDLGTRMKPATIKGK